MTLVSSFLFRSLGVLSNVSVSGPDPEILFATIGEQSGGTIELSYQATGTINVTVLIVPLGTFTNTVGLADQITNQTAPGGIYRNGTLTSLGSSIPLGSIPDGLDGDFDFFVMPVGGTDNDIVYAQSATIDSLDPTLSAANADSTGETELTLTITSDEDNGIIYARDRDPLDPISTQVELLASLDQNTNPVTGTNGILISGLTTGVERVIDALQVDNQGNVSNIITSNAATPATPTVFSDVFAYPDGTVLNTTANWNSLQQSSNTIQVQSGSVAIPATGGGASETVVLNMPDAVNVDVEFDLTEMGVSNFALEGLIKIDTTDLTTKLIFLVVGNGGTARLRGFTANTLQFERFIPTPVTPGTYRFVSNGTQVDTYINGVLDPSASGAWAQNTFAGKSGIFNNSNSNDPTRVGRIRAEILP